MFPVLRTNGRNLFAAEPWAHFDRLFHAVADDGPNPQALMPVDICEQDHDLLLTANVPGATPGDVNITVEDGALTIAYNRKAEEASENGPNYVVRERASANVARTFRLPETADLDKVEASLANGVLTLRIPRKEEAKPRQIPVK